MAGTDDQPSELRTGDSEDSGVGTVRGECWARAGGAGLPAQSDLNCSLICCSLWLESSSEAPQSWSP